MNNKNINTNPEVELEAEVIIDGDDVYNLPENKAARDRMFGMLFQVQEEDEKTSKALEKLFS